MPPKGFKAGKAPPAGKGKAVKPASPLLKPKAKSSIRITRRPKVDLSALPPPELAGAADKPAGAPSPAAQAPRPSSSSTVDRKVAAPALPEPPFFARPAPFTKDHTKVKATVKDDMKAKPPAKEDAKAKPPAREEPKAKPHAREDSWGEPPEPAAKEDTKAASPASAESLRRVASFDLPLPPPLKPKAQKQKRDVVDTDDAKDEDADEEGWCEQDVPEVDAEQRRRAEEAQKADRERRVRAREISRSPLEVAKPALAAPKEAESFQFIKPSVPEGPRAEAKRRKLAGRAENAVAAAGHMQELPRPRAEAKAGAAAKPAEPAESALKPDDVRRLLERLKPEAQIDDAACKLISLMADRMLDDVVRKAARLASHRGARALQARDINFVLEEEWGLKQRKDD